VTSSSWTPPPQWKLYFITLLINRSCSHWSSLLAQQDILLVFSLYRMWLEFLCMLLRVVVTCCWKSLSENLWLFDVLSSGNNQGQIWCCGERFYFVSAVLARKLLYCKRVIRWNYSLENIGGAECHWLLQSTWTLAWCLGGASLTLPFTMCFMFIVFGQKLDNEIGLPYLPDLAQCEFWLFYVYIWGLIWKAIDFRHFWRQEEQGKKYFEQCKWELSVLLCKITMFKVIGTISM
jgi:hypothetical protein